MYMRDYAHLHLDSNFCKGTALLLLFYISLLRKNSTFVTLLHFTVTEEQHFCCSSTFHCYGRTALLLLFYISLLRKNSTCVALLHFTVTEEQHFCCCSTFHCYGRTALLLLFYISLLRLGLQ